jgi:hypothetical protein
VRHAFRKIDIVPLQAEQLAHSEACVDSYIDEGLIVGILGVWQKGPNLVGVERSHFPAFAPWRFDYVSCVSRYDLPFDGALKGLVEHPVMLQNSCGGKVGPPLPVLAPRSHGLRIVRLDLHRSQLSEQVPPERGTAAYLCWYRALIVFSMAY